MSAPLATGLALLLLAPLGGTAAAVALAPLGAAALALALWEQRGREPLHAPWHVALGAATAGVGALLAIGPGGWAAAAAALVGLAFARTGTAAALARDADERPNSTASALTQHLAAGTDLGLQWVWHVTALVQPAPPAAAIRADLEAAALRNADGGILHDPAQAHATPPALEKLERREVTVRGAGAATELCWESEFSARDPEIRVAWAEHGPNRIARAHVYRHAGGPRPTLVCLHGYGMGRDVWDARALEAAWLHEGLGLDVALVTLPLHGPRADGSRSGAGLLDGHPLALNAGIEQAVWDTRRLIGWLRREGAPAVGVLGMSLGGYTAAVLASVERGLACAVPWIPAADFTRILAAGRSRSEQAARAAADVDDALLADAWASHDPLRHTPRVPPEGRLIVAAAVDRICPPDHARALWEHWDQPSIHWGPGSHLVRIGRAAFRERLVAHLRGSLIVAGQGGAETLSRFRGAAVPQP